MTKDRLDRFDQAIDIIRSQQSKPVAIVVHDASIIAAQTSLAIRLPESYKLFIKAIGTTGWPEYIYGLGDNILPGSDVVWQTQNERNNVEPEMPLYLLPFSPDGWGNHYCLDTRKYVGDECRVVFWNHELSHEQEPEFVSNDFLEWLESAIAKKPVRHEVDELGNER